MGRIRGMLDPGHSKRTGGKANPPYYEYKSNRDVAVKLKKLLESTGKFEILFPFDLDDPRDMPLHERAAAAVKAGCKFFVSIHSNASSASSARGTETYIHDNTKASVPFAEVIQKEMIKALGTRNRGVKRENFGVLRGTYQHMLSCLTEGEFFSNPAAVKWMLTEDYSTKYAAGVANGLCEFYGVDKPKVEKPKPKEEAAEDMEQKAVVVNSTADLGPAALLTEHLGAVLVFRHDASSRQVAKEIYICGGGKKDLKGDKFIDLTGSDRVQTAKKVMNYIK
jgi:hypothetical protein